MMRRRVIIVLLVGVLSLHAAGRGLDEWAQRQIGQKIDLNAIAYGDGTFVAVGEAGNIYRSTNGVQWESTDSPVTTRLRGIVYGSGRFVAVGDGGITIRSTNGLDWTRHASGSTGELFSVTFGRGLFVGVGRFDSGMGYQGVIITSADGEEWFEQRRGEGPLYAVGHGEGLLIAVGHLVSIVSTNGADWEQSGMPNYGPIYTVAYGNRRYVTGASDLYTPRFGLSVSEDGRQWQGRTTGADGPINGIAYGAGLFAGVGSLSFGFEDETNKVAVSADGDTWQLYDIGIIPELRGVAYGGEAFVAVGVGGTIIQSGPVRQPRIGIQRTEDKKSLELSILGEVGWTYTVQIGSNLTASVWWDWMTVTNPETKVLISTETGVGRYFRVRMH